MDDKQIKALMAYSIMFCLNFMAWVLFTQKWPESIFLISAIVFGWLTFIILCFDPE